VDLKYAIDRLVDGVAQDKALIAFPTMAYVVLSYIRGLPWVLEEAFLHGGILKPLGLGPRAEDVRCRLIS
jgi:hypothetical protein